MEIDEWKGEKKVAKPSLVTVKDINSLAIQNMIHDVIQNVWIHSWIMGTVNHFWITESPPEIQLLNYISLVVDSRGLNFY